MKTVILFILLLPLICRGQADSAVFQLNTSIKVTLKKTGPNADGSIGVLELSLENNRVFQTTTGQYYVKYTENGNEKQKRFGWETGHRFEGMPVFSKNEGTRFYYLQIDKQGLPYTIELPAWVFGK